MAEPIDYSWLLGDREGRGRKGKIGDKSIQHLRPHH